MRRGPRKNVAERAFVQVALSKGWDVTKRGWPDFICFRGKELILVEVKPQKTQPLLRSQYRLMKALVDRGISCYRWSPDTGFQHIY